VKLYEAPRNTRVRTVEGGNEFIFHHVDGAYSYCVDDEGHVVHLAAWTDVEIMEQKK
jgi:hypothetical protein